MQIARRTLICREIVGTRRCLAIGAVLVLMLLASCQRPVAQAPPSLPSNTTATASANERPGELSTNALPDVADKEPAEPTEPPADAQANTEPTAETNQAPPQAEATADQTADSEQPKDDAESSAGELSDDEVADEQPRPKERFLLLTRDGPLVIDLVMTIDGEDYHRALEQVVDKAFAEADSDGDGEASWQETIANPEFAYGQFGNLVPEDESQRSQLIEMYDNNRNGLVDREELPRFVTRNAGGSRPFSLQSSNEFRGDNRSRSPIRRLLDVDRDGAITPEEMEVAPARLFNRDADDDEILVLSDFKDTVAQSQRAGMSNQRRVNAPDTAILFRKRLRWGYVAYALGETYAYGDRVGSADIPLVPQLVEQLDENENELLDYNEVPKLADIPPHLVIEVSFFNHPDETGQTAPRLRLVSMSDALREVVRAIREHPSRLSLDVPGAEIEFFANDDPSLNNTAQVLTNQFNMLDADSNGYLDEDEYPGQVFGFTVPFVGVDADEDGMIEKREVAALLAQRQAVVRAQIHARAADQEDALFTALDTDGNGRLTAREIYQTPQTLASLDANGDGRLQSHEIPGTMAVGFVRSNAAQVNNLFNAPAISSSDDEQQLPKWFRGMDSNGDGDVSPREFLGTKQQFDELDTDSDGFISGREAGDFVARQSGETETPDG